MTLRSELFSLVLICFFLIFSGCGKNPTASNPPVAPQIFANFTSSGSKNDYMVVDVHFKDEFPCFYILIACIKNDPSAKFGVNVDQQHRLVIDAGKQQLTRNLPEQRNQGARLDFLESDGTVQSINLFIAPSSPLVDKLLEGHPDDLDMAKLRKCFEPLGILKK